VDDGVAVGQPPVAVVDDDALAALLRQREGGRDDERLFGDARTKCGSAAQADGAWPTISRPAARTTRPCRRPLRACVRMAAMELPTTWTASEVLRGGQAGPTAEACRDGSSPHRTPVVVRDTR
jgi:hypothetical protein